MAYSGDFSPLSVLYTLCCVHALQNNFLSQCGSVFKCLSSPNMHWTSLAEMIDIPVFFQPTVSVLSSLQMCLLKIRFIWSLACRSIFQGKQTSQAPGFQLRTLICLSLIENCLLSIVWTLSLLSQSNLSVRLLLKERCAVCHPVKRKISSVLKLVN